MKFSVLLPTRNRLEYLRYAVTSVLNQDYDNWELIISDNHSEEDIQGYVKSLADSRIKYSRTQSFVPVTDNWNNAMEKATGDYVIMLGDDDALTRGYFQNALKLINKFENPDLLYSSAYLYSYPHVLPGHSLGLLQIWGNASFLEGKKDPFFLKQKEQQRLVKKAMGFKILYNYNMQFALISLNLIAELKREGVFFHSPYPDYYAMTALFLKARRILAIPYPLVIIGICPKSFGYFYFNEKESQGVEFLKNHPNEQVFQNVKKILLPGTNMNSSWLFALETLKMHFEKDSALKVNYKKYRLLQTLYHYKKFVAGKGISRLDMWNFAKKLFWWEKIAYFFSFYFIFFCIRVIFKKNVRDRVIHEITIKLSHPQFTMKQIDGQFNTILDVYKHTENSVKNRL